MLHVILERFLNGSTSPIDHEADEQEGGDEEIIAPIATQMHPGLGHCASRRRQNTLLDQRQRATSHLLCPQLGLFRPVLGQLDALLRARLGHMHRLLSRASGRSFGLLHGDA